MRRGLALRAARRCDGNPELARIHGPCDQVTRQVGKQMVGLRSTFWFGGTHRMPRRSNSRLGQWVERPCWDERDGLGCGVIGRRAERDPLRRCVGFP